MTAPSITPEIVSTFKQGASEAAEAWQRAFAITAAEFSFGEPADVLTQVSRDEWNAAGLAVILGQASGAIALLVADPTSAFPEWLATPDASAKSRLATLAQELGMIALPADLMPTSEAVVRIENLQEALLRCQPAGGVDVLPLTIKHGEVTLQAILLGVADGALLTAAPTPVAAAAPPPAAAYEPTSVAPTPTIGARFSAAPAPQEFEDGIPSLPPFTRSLLKIQVAVVASLATTNLPVGRILEIGPGSIIQFDQSCEQPLSLAVGDNSFAVGEAVKVGEKFGVRITSMVMPDERFWSVRGRRG
ncbi:FliM/FliN family flagellar motor C-terminal domain-containing protein [Anatilimnocola floriformis]|uniref:FliM/FliN family flagellar motor C-terminal domain-containing protein n=1 Tax=Anatilimnocola floriformis TaxID=2948575 RepID=UPI0020C1DA5A|nr:FliM/FliN family flagellar motor C-terminal domain-containing protein [Anatilimnocola floriformis]